MSSEMPNDKPPKSRLQRAGEKFIRAWVPAANAREAAIKLGWSMRKTLRMFKFLRREGVNVHPLPLYPAYILACKPSLN